MMSHSNANQIQSWLAFLKSNSDNKWHCLTKTTNRLYILNGSLKSDYPAELKYWNLSQSSLIDYVIVSGIFSQFLIYFLKFPPKLIVTISYLFYAYYHLTFSVRLLNNFRSHSHLLVIRYGSIRGNKIQLFT